MSTISPEAQRLANRLRKMADEVERAARYGVPIPFMVSVNGHDFGGASFSADEDEFAAWVEYTEAVVERSRHHGADWSRVDVDCNGLPLAFSVRHEVVRPLTVIDPEDREQVERQAQRIDAMQAALREYANPTPAKPAMPLGLGAVVEDTHGRKFVRVAEAFDGWAKDQDWQRIGGEVGAVRNFGWDDINAVRVLSEGVGQS